MAHRDENNNIVESPHQTEPFQQGILVSSTVSDDFIALQLVKTSIFQQRKNRKFNQNVLFYFQINQEYYAVRDETMPVKRSYSSHLDDDELSIVTDSDDDVLIIDTDYEDIFAESKLKPTGSFNEKKRRYFNCFVLLKIFNASKCTSSFM